MGPSEKEELDKIFSNGLRIMSGFIIGCLCVGYVSDRSRENAIEKEKSNALTEEAITHHWQDLLFDIDDNKKMMKKPDFDSIKKLGHFPEVFKKIEQNPVTNPITKDTTGFIIQ